jgi:Immunoglobulin I-set domain
LRIPRNSLLCALLTGRCISLFACGYAGTPPGLKTNPATAAPTITQQPASQTVTAGQAATFSVTASGDAPMNYQWFMNGAAAGTNSSAFSIAQTATGQTGAQIYVVVTNAGGSATSATVTLTVTAAATAPMITQQPVSATVTAGQSAAFSVMATGTAPLSYQWFLNGTASGTNSNLFSIAQASAGQTGAQIYVKVSNATGSVTSATVTLTVTAAATAPTITQQPLSVSVTAGQSAAFSVMAKGTAPLTYQWFLNGTAAGTNSSAFSIAQTTTGQTGAQIYVKVSNATGSVTSATVTLTVTAAATAPTITQQPLSVSVTAGQSAAFSVVATGTAPLTYQWFLNGTAAGTNSSAFSIAQTTTGQTGAQIQVKVSNATGSAISNAVTLTVNPVASTAPAIAQQPTNAIVTVGQSATFTVTATGTAPLTYQWFMNGGGVGTNSSTYTISQTTLGQTGAQIYVQVTNAVSTATSQTVTLTVNAVQASTVNVLTYHNDLARTGQNLSEATLTTANVKSTSFGMVGTLSVDGGVDAEPLYVSNLTLAGGVHNVVYVVTENDSVYAFDADTLAQLWHVSVLGANETASDNRGCGQVSPIIGITSTPVIDLSAGTHGEIFVVAMSLDNNGNYHQRLHALDVTSGAETSGSPVTVQATFPTTNGTTTFDPKQYKDRAALLLLNGVIYTTWASHCDDGPYTGWVIGYNEKTLAQSGVLDLTPNGSDGAIWMSGDGPAADSAGNIYLLDGNGTFDDTLNSNGFPEHGDYGNGFIKISTASNSLSVADYFTMFNTDSESDADQDLGSGGEILLPDLQDGQGNTWHLAVGAGKDGHIYVANRDLMGKFNTNNDSAIYQEIDSNGLGGGVWSVPAYFNNKVYYGAVSDHLRAFSIANAKLGTPASSMSATSFGYPGTTPSISANGDGNGIVWAVENNGGGVLHAYDATNLGTELYNSNQAANNRDHFADNKFITPMIANGKVYVGTPNGVAVFGLLP